MPLFGLRTGLPILVFLGAPDFCWKNSTRSIRSLSDAIAVISIDVGGDVVYLYCSLFFGSMICTEGYDPSHDGGAEDEGSFDGFPFGGFWAAAATVITTSLDASCSKFPFSENLNAAKPRVCCPEERGFVLYE